MFLLLVKKTLENCFVVLQIGEIILTDFLCKVQFWKKVVKSHLKIRKKLINFPQKVLNRLTCLLMFRNQFQ